MATLVVLKFEEDFQWIDLIYRLWQAASLIQSEKCRACWNTCPVVTGLLIVIQREPWKLIKDDHDDIKKIVASFCGEICRVPPGIIQHMSLRSEPSKVARGSKLQEEDEAVNACFIGIKDNNVGCLEAIASNRHFGERELKGNGHVMEKLNNYNQL
ncbi:hypothetical protein V6N13_026017 [Hibiscus sabdariffa]